DKEVREVLERLQRTFPSGIKYDITYSVREQIDESVSQVQHTLFEAFLLVFLIVFIFLQDFRSTLIPAIAIPVSLIGTYFLLILFVLSINVLTITELIIDSGKVEHVANDVVDAVYQK